MIGCITNEYAEKVPNDTSKTCVACIKKRWHQAPEKRPAAEDMVPDMENTLQEHGVDDLAIAREEQDESLPLLSKAINKTYPDIHYLIGRMFFRCTEVKKDYARAMK
ncbi:hypothetical protein BGZ58_004596 [Dissophora ornata]|nr:hypothetical protein BGZ58_004596 [Dissophora ornata]